MPDRCPACGAALPAGAGWCTLCFADLRPKPAPEPVVEPVAPPVLAPVPEPAPAYAAVPAHSETLAADPLFGPLDGVPAAGELAPAPAAPAAPASGRASWPCSACDATVPMELDACPVCGTGFLAGLAGEGLDVALPGVGDPRSLSSGAKWAVAGIGALAVCLVFVLVAVVAGALL